MKLIAANETSSCTYCSHKIESERLSDRSLCLFLAAPIQYKILKKFKFRKSISSGQETIKDNLSKSFKTRPANFYLQSTRRKTKNALIKNLQTEIRNYSLKTTKYSNIKVQSRNETNSAKKLENLNQPTNIVNGNKVNFKRCLGRKNTKSNETFCRRYCINKRNRRNRLAYEKPKHVRSDITEYKYRIMNFFKYYSEHGHKNESKLPCKVHSVGYKLKSHSRKYISTTDTIFKSFDCNQLNSNNTRSNDASYPNKLLLDSLNGFPLIDDNVLKPSRTSNSIIKGECVYSSSEQVISCSPLSATNNNNECTSKEGRFVENKSNKSTSKSVVAESLCKKSSNNLKSDSFWKCLLRFWLGKASTVFEKTSEERNQANHVKTCPNNIVKESEVGSFDFISEALQKSNGNIYEPIEGKIISKSNKRIEKVKRPSRNYDCYTPAPDLNHCSRYVKEGKNIVKTVIKQIVVQSDGKRREQTIETSIVDSEKISTNTSLDATVTNTETSKGNINKLIAKSKNKNKIVERTTPLSQVYNRLLGRLSNSSFYNRYDKGEHNLTSELKSANSTFKTSYATKTGTSKRNMCKSIKKDDLCDRNKKEVNIASQSNYKPSAFKSICNCYRLNKTEKNKFETHLTQTRSKTGGKKCNQTVKNHDTLRSDEISTTESYSVTSKRYHMIGGKEKLLSNRFCSFESVDKEEKNKNKIQSCEINKLNKYKPEKPLPAKPDEWKDKRQYHHHQESHEKTKLNVRPFQWNPSNDYFVRKNQNGLCVQCARGKIYHTGARDITYNSSAGKIKQHYRRSQIENRKTKNSRDCKPNPYKPCDFISKIRLVDSFDSIEHDRKARLCSNEPYFRRNTNVHVYSAKVSNRYFKQQKPRKNKQDRYIHSTDSKKLKYANYQEMENNICSKHRFQSRINNLAHVNEDIVTQTKRKNRLFGISFSKNGKVSHDFDPYECEPDAWGPMCKPLSCFEKTKSRNTNKGHKENRYPQDKSERKKRPQEYSLHQISQQMELINSKHKNKGSRTQIARDHIYTVYELFTTGNKEKKSFPSSKNKKDIPKESRTPKGHRTPVVYSAPKENCVPKKLAGNKKGICGLAKNQAPRENRISSDRKDSCVPKEIYKKFVGSDQDKIEKKRGITDKKKKKITGKRSDNGTEPFVRESDSHLAGFMSACESKKVGLSFDFEPTDEAAKKKQRIKLQSSMSFHFKLYKEYPKSYGPIEEEAKERRRSKKRGQKFTRIIQGTPDLRSSKDNKSQRRVNEVSFADCICSTMENQDKKKKGKGSTDNRSIICKCFKKMARSTPKGVNLVVEGKNVNNYQKSKANPKAKSTCSSIPRKNVNFEKTDDRTRSSKTKTGNLKRTKIDNNIYHETKRHESKMKTVKNKALGYIDTSISLIKAASTRVNLLKRCICSLAIHQKTSGKIVPKATKHKPNSKNRRKDFQNVYYASMNNNIRRPYNNNGAEILKSTIEKCLDYVSTSSEELPTPVNSLNRSFNTQLPHKNIRIKNKVCECCPSRKKGNTNYVMSVNTSNGFKSVLTQGNRLKPFDKKNKKIIEYEKRGSRIKYESCSKKAISKCLYCWSSFNSFSTISSQINTLKRRFCTLHRKSDSKRVNISNQRPDASNCSFFEPKALSKRVCYSNANDNSPMERNAKKVFDKSSGYLTSSQSFRGSSTSRQSFCTLKLHQNKTTFSKNANIFNATIRVLSSINRSRQEIVSQLKDRAKVKTKRSATIYGKREHMEEMDKCNTFPKPLHGIQLPSTKLQDVKYLYKDTLPIVQTATVPSASKKIRKRKIMMTTNTRFINDYDINKTCEVINPRKRKIPEITGGKLGTQVVYYAREQLFRNKSSIFSKEILHSSNILNRIKYVYSSSLVIGKKIANIPKKPCKARACKAHKLRPCESKLCIAHQCPHNCMNPIKKLIVKQTKKHLAYSSKTAISRELLDASPVVTIMSYSPKRFERNVSHTEMIKGTKYYANYISSKFKHSKLWTISHIWTKSLKKKTTKPFANHHSQNANCVIMKANISLDDKEKVAELTNALKLQKSKKVCKLKNMLTGSLNQNMFFKKIKLNLKNRRKLRSRVKRNTFM